MSTLVPIVDLNRGFRVWGPDEVYTGPSGKGKYVPNLDDGVWDWKVGMRRVVEVDTETGLSRIEDWDPVKENGAVDSDGLLYGVGPGMISETYKLFVDTTVTPNVISCDAKLRIYGSSADHIKIFRGRDITGVGKVISLDIDQNNYVRSDKMHLELVATDDLNNKAIRAPMSAHTTEEMDDGELVTAVVYDDRGGAISINPLVVVKTSFIRRAERPLRYITHIELSSPNIDPSEPEVLNVPAGMPISNIIMMGIVHYNDGSKVERPVDGTKFKMYNMDQQVAGAAGESAKFTLTYFLDEDEVSFVAAEGEKKHISRNYELAITSAEHQYNVKLFGYPRWVSNTRGYEMRYYLCNLDRDIVMDVTQHIQIAGGNTGIFNPLLYGTLQTFVVALNMKDADPTWVDYRHVQTMNVKLYREGGLAGTGWEVGYLGEQGAYYGDTVVANVLYKGGVLFDVNLDSGALTKTEWLNKLYLPIVPLYDTEVEDKAPTPTHFNLRIGDRTYRRTVSQWNAALEIDTVMSNGDLIYIDWIQEVNGVDLYLGVSALKVQDS